MRRIKKTESFSDLASKTLDKVDKNGKLQSAKIVSAWDYVVGDEIRKHTSSIAIRDKTELIVCVDSASWAQQLSLMSDELLERLWAHFGQKIVKTIRFTVSHKVQHESVWERKNQEIEAFYIEERITPVPLDELETLQASQIAEVIRDPKLRETALRVMIKDLEIKKAKRGF